MRSIELVFNDDLDAAVRAEWQVLASAGLPSLASHRSPSNRPHVTLAAGEELAHDTGVSFDPLPIQLGAVTLFPRRSGFVLARAVVVSRQLLEFHRELHATVLGSVPNTLPDAWSPHVTLSRRLSGEQVVVALGVLGDPPSGELGGLRLWDSVSATVTALP